MKFEDLKKELLKNDKFKKSYFEKDEANLAIEIGSNILDARISAGLTQEELAKKVGTQQPGIARAENGSQLQSNSFLLKIARVLDIDFIDLVSSKNSCVEDFCRIDLRSIETKDEPKISIYWDKSNNSLKTEVNTSSNNI